MITYYTVLLIAYYVDAQEYQAKMLFTSHKQCQDAMDAIYPVMHNVSDDVIVQCLQSATVSSTVLRPRARPGS